MNAVTSCKSMNEEASSSKQRRRVVVSGPLILRTAVRLPVYICSRCPNSLLRKKSCKAPISFHSIAMRSVSFHSKMSEQTTSGAGGEGDGNDDLRTRKKERHQKAAKSGCGGGGRSGRSERDNDDGRRGRTRRRRRPPRRQPSLKSK